LILHYKIQLRFLIILATILVALSYASDANSDDVTIVNKVDYVRPLEIPFPDDNLFSLRKAELGKKLFFDPRLSINNNISCATCHDQKQSWEDGKETSIGNLNTKLTRHTPTVLNMAWGELYFWDGRAETLEEQAIEPIKKSC